MATLVIAFVKIFYRNPRGLFFTILMPAGIFLVTGFFGSQGVIDFRSDIPYGDFLLPGMIAYALMQAGVYSTAYSLIDYKRSRVLQRISVTPLRAEQFLFAQSLARFIIAILQSVVLIVLAILLFDTKLPWSTAYLPLLIFLGGTMFLNFGFLIAAIARDYEEAAPYTVLLALPLSLLGDVFFPIRNLPEAATAIANFLPLKPLVSLMRQSFGSGHAGALDLVVILVWFLAGTVVAQWAFRRKAYR